jgi:hypothetical protein
MTHARPPRPHIRPQFATMIKVSDQVPPFPSERLPHDTILGAIRGWPIHYPVYTIVGVMRYRPTQRPLKLLVL